MKIAVEGCCHGELDAIYDTLELLQRKNNCKVDLLLICGDFQSVRNNADLNCMAVPQKHRKMNSFYKYYSGEKVAPVLTVFIGGNHEASNYLQSLPYGGWVAPKIYYMGYAGVVQFGGVRIGGMSGIYKGKDFRKGHFEHPPYTEETKRSAYHLRTFDVYRLKQLRHHIDIFMSHDWPQGIHKYGNVQQLLQRKKFFAEEVEKNTLGNPVAMELLLQLQPTYWFSAHLHVKFPALVQHSADDDSKTTKFLSLDKCLPRRHFLQVFDIPNDSSRPLKLELDPEWLAIMKLTNSMINLSRTYHYPGTNIGERESSIPTEEEIKAVVADFGGDLTIPDNFQQTVPVFNPAASKKENNSAQAATEVNPQTTLLCSMLDLTDPNAVFLGKDSTFNLPNDSDYVDANQTGDDKGDEVDDEDYESEPSFYSMSESDRSFSDRSFSLLSSTGNESGLMADESLNSSVGNPDEIPLDEEQGNANGNAEETPAGQLDNLCNTSLSEKLKNLKSNSASTSATSESSLEEEGELSEILKAQKKASNDIASEVEKVVSDNSSLHDSSVECRDLDINDDDPELLEMLKSQKAASALSGSKDTDNCATKRDKCMIEASLDNDDIEFQSIMDAQKTLESGTPLDIQRDFLNIKPAYQSSPLPSVEERMERSYASKDLSPRTSTGFKRGEEKEVQQQSPVTKKFRRRNQELYSDNSTGDEDAA